MVNSFAFNIGGYEFTIEDIGQLMNQQFQKLYEYYLLGKNIDLSKFYNESSGYFDNNSSVDTHDRYFNNFTPLWGLLLQQGLFFHADQLWQIAIEAAKKWEENQRNQNYMIHKGAPMYFWGVTCILKEDLEKGFLLIHEALNEDRRNINPDDIQGTPVYAFITLNYEQQKQYFRPKVLEISQFLSQKLNVYQSSRNGRLTMSELRGKFLQNSDLVEQVILFVYELFHLKKLLSENKKGLTHNVYGSMLMVQSIFTFSLLIDNIIKNKYNDPDPHKQQFIDLLIYLSERANLNLDKSKLLKVKEMFTDNPSQTVEDLVNSRPIFRTKIQPLEGNMVLSYCFRNAAAHKIGDRPYIHVNYNNIVDRLFNLFFLAVETLF
jgi:hypothetical protein